MFPKEHGAWNCLILSSVAGWFALGHWSEAAGAVSVLWTSAFLIRGPWNFHRQYRRADRVRSRRALVMLAALTAAVLGSLVGAVALTSGPGRWMLIGFGLPLGSILMVLTVRNRNLRSPLAEVLGFLWLTLLVPETYLCDPSHALSGGFWLWGLWGGYFLLGIAGIKVRQKWIEGARKGRPLSPADRFSQSWWVILLYALWVEALGDIPGGSPILMIAPLFAALRTLAGLIWGRPDTPMMRLGLWEMAHSVLFTAIWALTWRMT